MHVRRPDRSDRRLGPAGFSRGTIARDTAARIATALAAAVLTAAAAGCTVVRQPPLPDVAPPRVTEGARLSGQTTGATALAADADVRATANGAAADEATTPPRPPAMPSATPTATRSYGAQFDPDETHVSLDTVATGLEKPVHATGDGIDPSRLYVVEKEGEIEILDLVSGAVAETPFLDLTDRVNSRANEQGLLSVAFHPDYGANGRLFVNYTRRDGATVVSEIAADADRQRADPATEREILVIDQPAGNHNGGQNVFGPDGYLYVGMGDGGGGGAGPNAQDPATLLGKVLRLDVDGPSGGYRVPADNPFVVGDFRPEVWAYGLRNPWRMSFDRATGDLFIADVGATTFEEVNWQPAGSRGGENYGWPDLEGDHCHGSGADAVDGDLTACDPDGRTTRPVAEYRHQNGNCSISGGHVYRGRRYPALDGVYFYGDYCSGRLWGAWRDGSGRWQSAVLTDSDAAISAFGQDDAGEVYAMDMGRGEVLRVVADGS